MRKCGGKWRERERAQEVLNSFGLFGDPRKAVHVRLRFSARVANIVLERPWHRGQQATLNSESALDLTILVAHTIDLENAILHWAGDIDILGPDPVRDAILARAEALVAALRKR